MLSTLLNFLLGLLLLIVCTQTLVKHATKLAYKLKLSPLVIGITLVAMGTSFPELMVSTVATLNGDVGLAVGNVVGSNIANVLLVLPIGIFAGKLRIGTTKTQRSAFLLALITLIYFSVHMFSFPIKVIALCLLFIVVLSTILEYKWGREGSVNEDKKRINVQNKTHTRFSFVNAFVLIAAVIGTSVGGISLVVTTESLARLFGLSTTVLGLSLTAVSTSLPELLTTLFSQEDNDEKLTIGNILGSNLFNIALIGGMVYLLAGNIFKLPIVNWKWLMGSSVMLVGIVLVYKGRVVPKYIGLVLLVCFIAYLYTLA